MTSYIAGEWNTRRIRVSKSRTKGKNERIAFAATENAKVWTSVRKRYFSVEARSTVFEFGIVAESFGTTDGETAGIDDGLGSFNFYPILSASYGASQN